MTYDTFLWLLGYGLPMLLLLCAVLSSASCRARAAEREKERLEHLIASMGLHPATLTEETALLVKDRLDTFPLPGTPWSEEEAA